MVRIHVVQGSAAPHIQVVSSAGPHVHSVAVDDNPIAQFFRTDSRNSLLISGDSEKALTSIPDGVFQTCVTSPLTGHCAIIISPGKSGLSNPLPITLTIL